MANKKHLDIIHEASYEKAYHTARAEIAKLRAELVAAQSETSLVLSEMDHLLRTTAGYYRIGRTNGGMYYTRFKWTTGPHDGYYEMGGDNNLSDSILCCVGQVARVLAGKKTPIFDRPYKK